MTSISSEYKLPEKTNTVSTNNSSLGKDEFLKILMTQVQNQDPLNPVDDKEFISQMATFSSLEQMMNLNTTMTQFVFRFKTKIRLQRMLIGWEKKYLGLMVKVQQIKQAQ